MSLKIIGAGFGRTGTLSTQYALNELGFPCYHMFEVLENSNNKNHLDFWRMVADSPEGQPHNWNEVFANYTATVDNPGCCVWRELVQAYPEAKVILTLHPKGPEAWYDSTYQTIYFSEYKWVFKMLQWFPPVKKITGMNRKLIWERSLKGTMKNKTDAIARYHEHMEEVKLTIPKEKLLIYSVDQGWEPLCRFLGVDVPQREFPNVNDRASIKKMIMRATMLAYLTLMIMALMTTGLLYGLIQLL
jgi:hypothetical protein